MPLRDFLQASDIHLRLRAGDKTAALAELVSHLGASETEAATIRKILERREALGSTGIGRGVAIPHCRTPLVPRLRVLFGRKPEGLPWDAVDSSPVTNIFLLVAPPVEVSNDYLPVLGRIAQLMKDDETSARLAAAASPAEVLELLSDQGG